MLWMWSLLAGAQVLPTDVPELNGQVFRPSIDAERTIWANDTRVDSGAATLRAALQYAHDPVVYVSSDGDKTPLVRSLWQASLLGGYSLGPLRIGLDVPVYLRASGSLGGETGLGDITPDLKLRLRDRLTDGLGLAVAGRLALPTSTVAAPLGNGGLGYEVEGLIDGEVGRTLLVANLGLRGVPRRELETIVWDDALSARLAASYAVSSSSGLSLELNGLLSLTNPGASTALPAEAMLGGYKRLGPSFVVRGGVGTGLTPGIGAPVFRGLLAVGYEPGRARLPAIADSDLDGVNDEIDACPSQPEDIDGYLDTDGCPDPTRLLVRVVDTQGNPVPSPSISVDEAPYDHDQGLEVSASSVTVAVSAPGFQPLTQQQSHPGGERHTVTVTLVEAATTGGLRVSLVGPEGNPIADGKAIFQSSNDGPEFPLDGLVAQALPVGTGEVFVTAPGMRSQHVPVEVIADELTEVRIRLAPAKVEITGERIDIRESVYFQTNSAELNPGSFPLLDEVAETLIDHPELSRVRVEGHTDSRGSASYNLKLSARRAASVVSYLVGQGVAAARLESEGFGESRPLKAEESPEAWILNRRVDFFIVERTDDP